MNPFWEIAGAILGGVAEGSVYGRHASMPPMMPVAPSKPSTDPKAIELQYRFDRLSLICMAMWELMKKQGLTDEQLLEKMKELDLADGQADGKAGAAKVATCSNCGRVVSTRHRRCLYCGHERDNAKPFDTAG